jgi:hypothetical protein
MVDASDSAADQDDSQTLLKVAAIACIVGGLVLFILGGYLFVTALGEPFDVDRGKLGALLLAGGGLMTTPGILLDPRARDRLRGLRRAGGHQAQTIRTMGTVVVVLGVVGIGIGLVFAATKMAGADGFPSWPVLSVQFGLDVVLVAGGLMMRRWVGRA